jgi:hypothetical protein
MASLLETAGKLLNLLEGVWAIFSKCGSNRVFRYCIWKWRSPLPVRERCRYFVRHHFIASASDAVIRCIERMASLISDAHRAHASWFEMQNVASRWSPLVRSSENPHGLAEERGFSGDFPPEPNAEVGLAGYPPDRFFCFWYSSERGLVNRASLFSFQAVVSLHARRVTRR